MVTFENKAGLNEICRRFVNRQNNPRLTNQENLFIFFNCSTTNLRSLRAVFDKQDSRHLDFFNTTQKQIELPNTIQSVTQLARLPRFSKKGLLKNRCTSNSESSIFKGNRFAFLASPTFPKEKATVNDLANMSCSAMQSFDQFKELLINQKNEPSHNITALGGIYQDIIIDHNQIALYLNNSENKIFYFHFKKALYHSLLKVSILLFCYNKKTIALLQRRKQSFDTETEHSSFRQKK